MKTEFLQTLGIDKDNIDKIMAENGRDIETYKNTVATLTTERDGLKTQLDAANTQMKSYKDLDIEGVKQKAADWEAKYNTDTQALKSQLDGANYNFAVQQATGGIKFTSEGAKKAFIADLAAKKLPVQDGKLLGLDDYRKEYEKADPGAFVAEQSAKPIVKTGMRHTGTEGANDKKEEANAALRSAFGRTTT